jgi:lysozyme
VPVRLGAGMAGVRTYGWDASHYDTDRHGPITKAIVARAVREGIGFATCKLTEHGSYLDPAAASTLAAFRDGGLELVGAYHVVRSTPSVAAQVAWCIASADRMAPWWRDFAGWFWQVDLERWSYDSVPASIGIDLGKALRAATGRPVVLYASHGQYGGQLGAWDGPLWNANYGREPVGPYRDVYPGDDSAGWAGYPTVPDLLQYSSKAVIAGLSTCDANAFRGTLAQLKARLMEDAAMAGFDANDLHFLLSSKALPFASPTESVGTALLAAQNNAAAALPKLDALAASQAGQDRALAGLTAAVAALAAGGGADIAPALAAIADLKATESAQVAGLLAEIRGLEARAYAAEQAAANALKPPAA